MEKPGWKLGCANSITRQNNDRFDYCYLKYDPVLRSALWFVKDVGHTIARTNGGITWLATHGSIESIGRAYSQDGTLLKEVNIPHRLRHITTGRVHPHTVDSNGVLIVAPEKEGGKHYVYAYDPFDEEDSHSERLETPIGFIWECKDSLMTEVPHSDSNIPVRIGFGQYHYGTGYQEYLLDDDFYSVAPFFVSGDSMIFSEYVHDVTTGYVISYNSWRCNGTGVSKLTNNKPQDDSASWGILGERQSSELLTYKGYELEVLSILARWKHRQLINSSGVVIGQSTPQEDPIFGLSPDGVRLGYIPTRLHTGGWVGPALIEFESYNGDWIVSPDGTYQQMFSNTTDVSHHAAAGDELAVSYDIGSVARTEFIDTSVSPPSANGRLRYADNVSLNGVTINGQSTNGWIGNTPLHIFESDREGDSNNSEDYPKLDISFHYPQDDVYY